MKLSPARAALSSAGSSSDSSRNLSMSGCRNRALSSKVIFASSASTAPCGVTTTGLISARLQSLSRKTLHRAVISASARGACSEVKSSSYTRRRAWHGRSPASGSTAALRIFSGLRAATSSISTPPSAEAINTGMPMARSTTMPRYTSLAISAASCSSTLETRCPSAPVCLVTSGYLNITSATRPHAWRERMNLTPPQSWPLPLKRPLPRPPA